jgi:hypothetical protein
MARRSDPVRIYQARRAAIESNLTGSGMALEDAERWLAAWGEARAQLSGLDVHHRDFWQAGADWIEAERGTR